MNETCHNCFGTGKYCPECHEPGCAEALRCYACEGSGQLPTGSSIRENGEPPPEAHPANQKERPQ